MFQPHPHQLTDCQAAYRFALAGNATFTIVSKATGTRFTYKVSKSKNGGDIYFVALMNGPDNEGNYQYLGTLKHEYAPGTSYHFQHGRKSRITPEAPSAKAFAWLWANIKQARLPETVEFWHESTCGRCGRKLTVPESISDGIGPECRKKHRERFSCE